MSMEEQLERLLAELGVGLEPAGEGPDDACARPQVSLFQSSRQSCGAFYRADLVEGAPQLRVMLPVDSGAAKMEFYLVRPSAGVPGGNAPLCAWFAALSAYSGSPAFEDGGREAAEHHLLFACAEVMKHLFWSGDLESMSFPAEITVRRLL